MPERASRTMLLRQGPVRPSKVLLESGSLAGEEDGTKNGEVSEKGKKGLSERSPTFVRRPRSDLAPGVRVVVKGAKMGTIRYVGEIRFAIGIWCGVELDEPVGRHNGEKYGVRYFYCRNNHGIYVPAYKVFPLGRLIEEVSPCSMSLDEPWSLDTDCTSLVSRKSGSFEEFLQETRLSESDIWRMLANQQQQLTENYNPDSSFAGMALNKIPLRGAAGVNPRSKIGSPPSSRVPETLLNNSRLHQITSTRSSNLQNPSKSNSTILSAGQVSTSRTRGVERKVLGPSNPSLDAKKVVIAMDHAKKSEKPVTKLQQPRNKPMASRASLLRESFTRIKESLPKRQLDGRASYKLKGNTRRQERTVSQENISHNNHINIATSQNQIRSTASQSLDDRNVPKAVRATENTTSTPITATSQSQNGLSVTGDARISPAKSEFENEILRLGETCEARSVELTVIRSELRRSSVAFSAMALAAQYWSERLKRTEGYSQQLKGQLQMAEKVILKAHNDIENLKKELRDEVCARRRDVEDFEQTRDHKLADLEQKHAAAVALLEKDFGRRLEEALEKERQKAESANDEVVSKRQLEELKIEHARALERLKACRAEEINALTDAQQDLERRLVEKTSQCRRVEEEAVALKDKLLQSADSQAQWLTKKVASLEKEVESLNAVLELKTAETRELMLDRRENQERKEKMVTMQEVIDKHRARIEDLTAQLDRKTAVQQQLTAENVKLHELSAKKDRIITQLDHDFEALKYRARDSNSFIVDVATPTHRPLQESRSVGAAATTPEADGVMSRSWHVPFGDARSARRINRRTSRKSSSSESKVSDEDSRVPTALDEVFSHEEQVVLGETVGSGQVAVSRA